jgi:hypothetical protein
MHACCPGCEGHVDHAPLELDQHVVAILAVVEAMIGTGHDEASVEHDMQISEIIAVVDPILASLAVVPTAALIEFRAAKST